MILTEEEGRNGEARIQLVDVDIRFKEKCCCILCCRCTQSYEIGNSVLLFGQGVGQSFPRTCLLGPDWGCSVLTLILMVGVSIVWLLKVAFPLHEMVGATGVISLVLLLWVYSVVAFSDPGIRPKQSRLRHDTTTEDIPCHHCQIYRPRGTIHCISCDACIDDLDHHCPWTGKCIGKRTIREFKVFLTLLIVHVAFIILTLAIWA